MLKRIRLLVALTAVPAFLAVAGSAILSVVVIFGFGVLEFTITDTGADRELHMCAYWHPAGAWGLMYWYALLPPHLFIFRSTTREILRRAKSR